MARRRKEKKTRVVVDDSTPNEDAVVLPAAETDKNVCPTGAEKKKEDAGETPALQAGAEKKKEDAGETPALQAGGKEDAGEPPALQAGETPAVQTRLETAVPAERREYWIGLSHRSLSVIAFLLRSNCAPTMIEPLLKKCSALGLRKAGYQGGELMHDIDHAIAEFCSKKFQGENGSL